MNGLDLRATVVTAAKPSRPAGARLWWWVVAAFAVQLVAWTAWFVIAAHHRVEEVPLATAGGGK